MSEENNENPVSEDFDPQEAEQDETPKSSGGGFFTRRNAVIAFGITAVLAVLLVLLVTVSYRYGVFDNYIKAQFVAKMADIGIVFDADVFRVTITPLQLELKNATFTDKKTGEKLFFVREANLGLTVQDLYAWQLSRDISIDTTEINGAEVWVKFDENGNSNFSNLNLVTDEAGSRVNFKYDSVKFNLNDAVIHFADVQHNLSGNARNVSLLLEPTNDAVPDEQKRYKFNFNSTESNFVYDGSEVEPIDIRAVGIADPEGAEISELKLTSPIGETSLSGTLTDWEELRYDLKVDSTVDLTQTSTIFPLGTTLRGVGNFNGTVTGVGENYKVEGEIKSDALSADNIYLKGVNVAATVAGTNSMYEANGKAIAELLTFEDFRIEFPQLIGNVRGSGTDFKWVGELQAISAKTPAGTLGGLFISDAVAEYKDEQFEATLGDIRTREFSSEDVDVQNLQARNVRLSSNGDVTNISVPNVRADSARNEDFRLHGVNAGGVKITNRPTGTDISADNLQARSVETDDARIRNLSANNFGVKTGNSATNLTAGQFRADQVETDDARIRNLSANNVGVKTNNGTTNLTAGQFRADQVDASGARIAGVNATDVTLRNAGNETIVFSNNLKVAKVETNAAVLGSLNVAGVRLTVRQGTIEGTSGDINAGDVALLKNANLPEGGKLQNVRINKPVFVVEPSGRYRASADMSIGGGVLGSVTLGAARASVNVSNSQIALNNLSANVMEGTINGDATIALNNRNRSNVNANFSNLDIGKLLALQGGRVIPIEGETTGQVNLSFNGTNFKTASGNLTADITANAGTAERGTVPVSGRVELSANNGLFNVETARLQTSETQLNATGRFDLSGDNSNLNIALVSANAAEVERLVRVLNLSPELEQQLDSSQVELAGNLNFNGNLTGNLSDPSIEGRASLETLRVRGQELGSLSSDVSVTPGGIELRNGLLKERDGGTLAFNVNAPNGGTNNTSVQATLDRVNIGNILAALPYELPATFRNLRADTSGTINLSGLPNEMRGEANIKASGGSIDGQTFDNLEARATFAGNQVNVEKFEAQFDDGFVRADGTYNTETSAVNLNITGKDVKIERLRPFIPNNAALPNIKGEVDLTAQVTGQADQPSTYNVNFSGVGRDVTLDDRALGQIEFSGKTENQQLNTTIRTTINGQQQEIAANVNFADENLPFRAETVFQNTDLAPYINLVRPSGNVPITGRATGRVVLEGNLRGVNEKGEREFSTAGLRGSAEFSQLALQIEETPLVATEPVSVRFTPNEVIVENAKFAGGGTNVVVAGTYALNDKGTTNLAVDGAVNLRVLNALSENAFFAGIANVEVRLTGTGANPRLIGSAEVDNASVAVFVGNERLTLQRVDGRILFTTNQAQIQELTGFLGGGKITASGGALLNGLELEAFRINLTGNNITAPLPPDFITTGDASVEVTGRRIDNRLTTIVAGAITAKRSLYTEDIDLADIIGSRGGGSITQSDSSGGDSILGDTRLDLRIVGRDALVVRNNLADLTASIDLRVTGDIDEPQIAGRIAANSGTITFRDNRYEIQRGILEFPPGSTGIEPYVNLQAETEIRGYQVVVSLTGDLANTETLNASVRSNPALPQADVVSLITTGNLSNTGDGIPTLAQSGINTAAEVLTDALINNRARKATDRLFGLNVFEIDPIISGQRLGASARLTVGRQINRNLLVTYSTNLSQDQNQVLALEYRVSNRLSFVAQYEQRSLSNVTQRNNNFSFEIRLRKRF
ncbi:MAG TPA: translocation/assembly module TamB domain-containing protein [Pyrinomonadaceae bacterium]|jgi:translocation and assembly module TamB